MARLDKKSFLNGLSGAIGKELVFKQYPSGTVVSKYPNMSRVKKSPLQKKNQGLFAQAVAYAQAINRDPKKRATYQEKLAGWSAVQKPAQNQRRCKQPLLHRYNSPACAV